LVQTPALNHVCLPARQVHIWPDGKLFHPREGIFSDFPSMILRLPGNGCRRLLQKAAVFWKNQRRTFLKMYPAI